MTAFQLPESAHAPCTRTMVGLAGPVPMTAACSVRTAAARGGPAWPAMASSPATARTAAMMIRRVPTGREASLTDIVVPFGYGVRGLVQEAEQRPVDLVSVSPGDGVRTALDDDELHVVDQAGQPLAGIGVGQDPVGVALHSQYRDVDLGQVAAEVGLPGADARDRRRGGSGGGDVPAGLERLVADQGAAEYVDVVEVVEKPLHPRP